VAAEAFYEPLGDGRFAATRWTEGPWRPTDQHAGPPAALLAREIAACEARPGTVLARIAFDILGPVPVGEVAVRARVLRPGRRVELLEAELSASGRSAMTARAWRMRTPEGADRQGMGPAADLGSVDDVPSLPAAASPVDLGCGYGEAVEWRFTEGRFDRPGPATVWTRLRHPLVAGEPAEPLSRVLVVADAASGVSSELDWSSWTFANTDLTLHVYRLPAGEWIGMQAATALGDEGVGLARSRLFDAKGTFGYGAQALFVAPR
jgi:hypothetical protein